MRRDRPCLVALALLLAACGDGAFATRARPDGTGPGATPHHPREVPARVAPPGGRAHATSGGPIGAPGPSATVAPRPVDRARYQWIDDDTAAVPLEAAFPAPAGFRRADLPASSFGAYLRGIPLRPAGSAVHTWDGAVLRPPGDPRIAAVVALDVGRRDLQQCADTALRLHAEWLWSRGEEDAIGYHFTSGDLATWARHRAGDRPVVDGARVRWARTAPATSGRAAFRQWLDLVFSYAGTMSLARHAAPVPREEVRPGDVLVLPGGPGHAILVLDVARDDAGRRVALLGQGFMPAQEAHVLASDGSAWFDLEVDAIDTPFWPEPFPWSSLRRIRTATGATDAAPPG